MYDRSSLARSIRRYLALMWDEESGWELRVERREVKDDQRPVGVVLLGRGQIVNARTSVNQGAVEELFPVTIYAYPKVGDDERTASAEADAIAEELRNWIALGLVFVAAEDEEEPPPWTGKAGPFRIPLWDYSETDLTGDERAGPEEPHDAIWVAPDSLSTQNEEDPQDGKRRTVVLEMRISISRPGRIGPTRDVGELTGGFEPVGP